MRYFALRKKNTAAVLTGLLFAAAAATALLAAFGVGWKGVWHILTAAALVTAIQLSQRYLLTGYEYILDPEDERLFRNRLTVIRAAGPRRTSVFSVPLGTMTAAVPYRKKKDLEKEFGTVSERMDFCPDLFPDESYWLLFEVNGVQTAVRLQCGTDFVRELKRCAGL